MSDDSKVLALKYRPTTFKDLIGQEIIAGTIYNSIKNNRSANAYLFTGIRGVGKTTIARIVAKSLNCLKGVEQLCNKNLCSNCNSITNSNHIDVLEMDAASKTGVDDVRELIEFSKYRPSIAKYKIFIIDEVHMLSKQAFNALLKTLEEPPSYIKFIFATTELKKIPVTVISRCQRYDLSRVNSDILFKYLKDIGYKENKKIDDDALKLIVKISEGSVRDALSLLDRALVSNNEDVLNLDYTRRIFGYIDKSSYITLIEIILKGDEELVLKHYRELYDSGIEATIFLNEFLEILYFIKNINYIKVDGTNFSLNDNDYKKILSLSSNIDNKTILIIWEFTIKTLKEINLVSNKNLLVEMFLIQLMYLNKSKKINKEINTLSKTLSVEESDNNTAFKTEAISQIKNINQVEEKIKKKNDVKNYNVENLDDIIQICVDNKEVELKYELENNVNLVSLAKNRIEISFNEKLNKNFVKDLSEKLYKWTGSRWIISFSKQLGEISKKKEKEKLKSKTIDEYQNSIEFIKLKKLISDIELLDIKKNNE
mgnify:FL=1